MQQPEKQLELKVAIVTIVDKDVDKQFGLLHYDISIWQRRYEEGNSVKSSVFYEVPQITKCLAKHFRSVNLVKDEDKQGDISWKISHVYDKNTLRFEQVRQSTYDKIRQCLTEQLNILGWKETHSNPHDKILRLRWLGETISFRTFRKTLHTYYADLKSLGPRSGVYMGGNVMPPNMDTEPRVDIRCPDTKANKLSAALCRVLQNDQYGREVLVFHGTCDPASVPFPNANDHDSMRWYAFEPNMSLDFIKEEAEIRARKGLEVGPPTLHVYRVKRPIQNLLLFADTEQWVQLGGHEHLLRNNICGVTVNPDTDEGRRLKKRAYELGCPLPEYVMAVRAQRFKIIRGKRGESCNGWVRLNAIGVLGKKMFPKAGFELALTHTHHEVFLELKDTFTVADDPERYGAIAKETQSMDEFDWHLTNIPPTPSRPSPKRRQSDQFRVPTRSPRRSLG